MSQAAIYCRISEDREGAGLGVERQEEDCHKLAAQLGATVAAVYVDNDISAYRRSARKPRKGYERMLDDAQAGQWDMILAWHTDRLHRSNVELEGYIDVCQPRSIPTYTVKAGNLDLSNAAGRLVARMLGAQARYQSEHMAEQIQRAREQRVFSGKNTGGPRPFGFEADGITIREAEADEIIRATEQVINGVSLSAIARDLNARGIPTSQGNEWTTTNARVMLMRPRNAGILVYQGKEAGEAAWPPIVPELTWRQMRAVIADPSRRTTRSNRVASLGSGIYACGICGGVKLKISTSGQGSKVRGYRCPEYNHLTQAAAPLDAFVERLIVRKLSEPESYARLTAAMPANTAGAQADLAAVESRLEELGKMYGAGEIDGRTLKAASEDLRARKAAAERRIGLAVAPRPVLAMLGGGIADVTARWNRADVSVKRAVLDRLLTVAVNRARRRGGRFDPDRIDWDWRE